MPDEATNPATAEWTRAADRDRLQPSQPIAVKIGGRQIALFLHHGEVLACNNRCPHEGYPLVEGVLDGNCVLTCNWHNWKFDLRTGATLYGGDNLRTYPVSVRDGAVWVDLSEAPREQRIESALAHLDAAMAEHDSARIARELARLGRAGAPPEMALARAIAATHTRLRDGMTHAYAAAEAWLRLRDTLTDEAMRLACASEALAYIAFDTLREREYPYTGKRLPWNAHAFAAAVEGQDEECAVALLSGALDAGLHFDDVEPALADAALAHYNDFGHSLIYLSHAKKLVARLGDRVERPVLCAWTRSLVYATREDLLPDFKGYADALKAWLVAGDGESTARSDDDSALVQRMASRIADDVEGQSVRGALDTLVAAGAGTGSGRYGPHPWSLSQGERERICGLHAGLMEAAARHLLRFDEAHARRIDNSVADNVGWLDFSHALTFGRALREQCERTPRLWPAGLLQLAMFVGRNKSYLDPGRNAAAALCEWAVADEGAFHVRAIARIVDHGIGLPIFPAHWLKTWTAVRDEIDAGVPASTRAALLAAVNRLLDVKFKQRHPLRMASQALRFVERED